MSTKEESYIEILNAANKAADDLRQKKQDTYLKEVGEDEKKLSALKTKNGLNTSWKTGFGAALLTFIVALTIPALAPVVAITGIPAIVGIGLLAGGALGYMGGAALGGTDKKIIESIVTKKEKHQKEIESPDFAKEICDEFVKVADQTIGKLAIQQAVGPDVIERDFYYHLSSTLAGGSTAKGSQYISVEQKTTNFTGETLSQLIKKAHDADKRTTPLSIDRERPSTTQTRTRKIANRISKLIANAGVPEDSPLSELSTLAAELKDLQKTGRENRNRRENQKPSIHQNF